MAALTKACSSAISVPALVKIQFDVVEDSSRCLCIDLPEHFILLLYMFTLALALAYCLIELFAQQGLDGCVVEQIHTSCK